MFKIGDVVKITNANVDLVVKIKLVSKNTIQLVKTSGPSNYRKVEVEDTKKITMKELNTSLGFETKYKFVKVN